MKKRFTGFSAMDKKDTNRFGSHSNHENRPLYKGPPPQGLSDARRAGSFFDLVTNLPWWRSLYLTDRVVTIPASYLNITIFIGNAQIKTERSTGF
jgi:hypothetical protein